jgi:uncharacterized protein (TIGR00369 family)
MSNDATTTVPERITPEQATAMASAGFGAALGLTFTEVSPDRLSATFTITPAQHQPYGLAHGGVYCAVIETMASFAGVLWSGGKAVGVNNNTDFLRSVRDGELRAVATPIHRGRSQQLWQVVITDTGERPIARGQVRLQNLPA